MAFEPQDPEYEPRVRASFARQTFMTAIGARLSKVAPGEIEIELPWRADLCQQHGFVHGGVATAIADSACGYAALSLMAPDAAVLTVEFKVNFLAPARGERLVARGRVAKAGRTLTVCSADVLAVERGREQAVATMVATLMALTERTDVPKGI